MASASMSRIEDQDWTGSADQLEWLDRQIDLDAFQVAGAQGIRLAFLRSPENVLACLRIREAAPIPQAGKAPKEVAFAQPIFIDRGTDRLLWLPRLPLSVNRAFSSSYRDWYLSERQAWKPLLSRMFHQAVPRPSWWPAPSAVDAWYFAHRIRALDADNAVASIKPLLEEIREFQILPNDDERSFAGFGPANMKREPVERTRVCGVLLRIVPASLYGYHYEDEKRDGHPHPHEIQAVVSNLSGALSAFSTVKKGAP